MRKWSGHLCKGQQCLSDTTGPDQANMGITDKFIKKVNDLARSDQHVTMKMLAVMVGSSIGMGSKEVQQTAKGTTYGANTATPVPVSQRPHFPGADHHQ